VTTRGVLRVAIALVASVAPGLSGCGQTGALYLPEDESATVITRPSPATTGPATPAPEATGGAAAKPSDKPPVKPPAKR